MGAFAKSLWNSGREVGRHGGVEGSKSASSSLSIRNNGSRINHYADFLCHPEYERIYVVSSPAGLPSSFQRQAQT
jgi:hypothetical protein